MVFVQWEVDSEWYLQIFLHLLAGQVHTKVQKENNNPNLLEYLQDLDAHLANILR